MPAKRTSSVKRGGGAADSTIPSTLTSPAASDAPGENTPVASSSSSKADQRRQARENASHDGIVTENAARRRNTVGLPPPTPSSAASTASTEGISNRERAKKLYMFDDLPYHLRDNAFILEHYRCYMNEYECLKSVFQLHNELGNIWTHLIGFLIFLALGIWVMIDVIPQGAGVGHYMIFLVLTLGSMGCMACSTTFHIMIPHENLERYKRYHALDYLGITLLIIASFVPCCYYVFVCSPGLQWGYLAMILCIGSAGIITPLTPWFEEEFFFWPRLAIYVAIVCSGLVPSVHVAFGTPVNATTLPIYVGVVLMFLLYGTGVVVYASHFPERFAPGRFDLYLHSHQIWHMFVLFAAVVHYMSCIAMYQNWQVMQGKC